MLSSQPPLWLNVLGHTVQITISGDPEWASVARARAEAAWGDLGSSLGAASGEAGESGREDAARELAFSASDEPGVASLLDQLSSRATLAGIEARSGELLMLHAAGLAHPETGRVVACVAPSGTGKTTLSRAAAGALDYVTDETVAVTRSGQVVRYPKPLSVKQAGEGWAPKAQHAPSEFGLRVAPAEGLSLAAIVLLQRVREDADEDAAGALPRFEPVELFDAIVALVPELSYLGRMPEPLRWLAETITRLGGVRRLRYREAERAIPVLRELLGHEAQSVQSTRDPIPDPIAESDAETARWREAMPTLAASSANETALPSLVEPIVDLLADPATGHVLLFSGNTVRLVSSVAAVALLAAERGLTVPQLRVCLTGLFGDPGEGRDEAPNAEAVVALLDSLKEHGLLA